MTCAFVLGLIASACRPTGDIARLPQDQPPQMRAAASFVHCVEAGTSSCIAGGVNDGGWDALAILIWLATGSPSQITDELGEQLSRHTDPALIQDEFVAEVERYAQTIRGGGCVPGAAARALTEVAEQAATRAATRLEALGLWQGGMDRVVAGLSEEAREKLGGGLLVQFTCEYDPFTLYVAAVERDGRFRAIGLTTLLDPSLGGIQISDTQVDARLGGRALGLAKASAPVADRTIDPWLPFTVEEF